MSGILQLGAAQYGEDYFVAYGESAPKVSKEVLEFSDRVSYYAGRVAVYAGNAAVAGKMAEAMNDPKKVFAKPIKGLPADFIDMFREVDMPSYYQGVKVSGEDSRALVRDQLEAVPNFFSMIEVGVEPLVVERGGAQFLSVAVLNSRAINLVVRRCRKNWQRVKEACVLCWSLA
jgi:hypothetical protein